jgi:hypothetical protein
MDAESLAKNFGNITPVDELTNRKCVDTVKHPHKRYGTTVGADDVSVSIY